MDYRKFYKINCGLFLGLLIFGCEPAEQEKVYLGQTQGTTYAIKTISSSKENLQPTIDSVLQVIDLTFSNYNNQSLLYKINQGADTLKVNDMFVEVFKTSEKIYKASGRLFDPTVGSLVKAWGFGATDTLTVNEKKIDSLLALTGFEKVSLLKDQTLAKCCPNIYLDFNAIAQGYTSDVMSKMLKQKGIENFMVEIGGEVYASGTNTLKNKPWTIGIDDPQSPVNERKLAAKVKLSNLGLATSGNYRKFKVDAKTGKKYVHTINPITGYPKMSNILSTTVIAPTATEADGYATAFMLMDLEKTHALLQKNKDLQVMIIYLDVNNQTKQYTTAGFKDLILK